MKQKLREPRFRPNVIPISGGKTDSGATPTVVTPALPTNAAPKSFDTQFRLAVLPLRLHASSNGKVGRLLHVEGTISIAL